MKFLKTNAADFLEPRGNKSASWKIEDFNMAHVDSVTISRSLWFESAVSAKMDEFETISIVYFPFTLKSATCLLNSY